MAAQDNTIPRLVWGGPSPVDSFNEGRNAALDYRMKEDAMARNKVLQGRDDTAYAQAQDAQKIDQLARAAFALDTPEKWAAQGPQVMQQLGIQGPMPQFSERGRLLAQAQSLKEQMAGQQQQFDNTMAGQKFDLDRRATEANIRQSDASAMASRALASQRLEPMAKPLPVRVQTAEDDDISAIQTTQSINTQLDDVLGQIQRGELQLGPINNLVGGVQNTLGMSTPNSRNLASFQATLEKIRNDSLRLNKGVQTEGDAVRAWNEVVRNINDPNVVGQQLYRIKKINEMAARQRQQQINIRRKRNAADPFDFNSLDVGAAPASRQPSTAPVQGTVEDGFEFQGGDPADPNNWEPVR